MHTYIDVCMYTCKYTCIDVVRKNDAFVEQYIYICMYNIKAKKVTKIETERK